MDPNGVSRGWLPIGGVKRTLTKLPPSRPDSYSPPGRKVRSAVCDSGLQRRPSFEDVAPEGGHVLEACLIGWLQRHGNVAVRPEEQRHVRQQIAHGQVLQVDLHPWTGDEAGQ